MSLGALLTTNELEFQDDAIKYKQLESVIEEEQNRSNLEFLDENDLLLPATEKIHLILREQTMINQLSSQLELMSQLLPFVEIEAQLQEVKMKETSFTKLTPQLEQIEISTVTQTLDVHTLLTQYNQIVSRIDVLMSTSVVYTELTVFLFRI